MYNILGLWDRGTIFTAACTGRREKAAVVAAVTPCGKVLIIRGISISGGWRQSK
jgi:hypothetical protein